MDAILDLPPIEVLNDRFKYDPDTGVLSRRRWGEGPAGYISGSGYLRVKCSGKHYKVARIVWKMYYGEDPPKNMSIDHINRNRLDNRIENLRLCSHSENQQNKARKRQPRPRKTIEELREIRRLSGEKTRKPIIVVAPDGREIRYESVKAATKDLKINNISSVLTGKRRNDKGFTARYAD